MAMFLFDLAENKQLLEAFTKDSEKIMAEAGLSEAEKDAIRKKDVQKIQQLAFAAKSDEVGAAISVVVTAVFKHDWINVFQLDPE